MLRVWCLIAVLLTYFVPAKAATTVYGSSVFSQSAPVANALRALGPSDGLSAVIGRNGTLTLTTALLVSGANVTVTGVKSGAAIVQIYVGAIVSGVPTFSSNINFPGAGGTATFDFSSRCAAISPIGCSLVLVRVVGPPGVSFALDGISGVSVAPEPESALLLLVAVAGLAMRLKSRRRSAALRLAPA